MVPRDELQRLLRTPVVREALRRVNPHLLARLFSPGGQVAYTTLLRILQNAALRKLILREARRLGIALWRWR